MKVRRNREERHGGRLLPCGCHSSVEMEVRVVVRSSASNQKELRVDLSARLPWLALFTASRIACDPPTVPAAIEAA